MNGEATIGLYNLEDLCDQSIATADEVLRGEGTERQQRDGIFGALKVHSFVSEAYMRVLRSSTPRDVILLNTYMHRLKQYHQKHQRPAVSFERAPIEELLTVERMNREIFLLFRDMLQQFPVREVPGITWKHRVAFGTLFAYTELVVRMTDAEELDLLPLHMVVRVMNDYNKLSDECREYMAAMDQVLTTQQFNHLVTPAIDQEELVKVQREYKARMQRISLAEANADPEDELSGEEENRRMLLRYLADYRSAVRTLLLQLQRPDFRDYPRMKSVFPVLLS